MNGNERLRNAFTQAIGVSPSANYESLEYSVTPGWDSVAHMNLIAEIESAFDIMLDTEDVIAMSSFQKAREIVGKYGVALEA